MNCLSSFDPLKSLAGFVLAKGALGYYEAISIKGNTVLMEPDTKYNI